MGKNKENTQYDRFGWQAGEIVFELPGENRNAPANKSKVDKREGTQKKNTKI